MHVTFAPGCTSGANLLSRRTKNRDGIAICAAPAAAIPAEYSRLAALKNSGDD